MKATYKEDYFVIPIKVGDTILTGRFRNKPVKVKEVGINENSKILLIGCEGLTDQKMYDQLLNSGLEKIKNV